MNFNVELYPAVAIIRIQTSNSDQTIDYQDIPHVYLADCESDKEFETHIHDIVLKLFEHENLQRIIVDLKNIDYLNSKGLGTLIYCDNLAYLKNIEFGIINIKESILKTFKVLTIDDMLKVYKEEEVYNNEKIKHVTGMKI